MLSSTENHLHPQWSWKPCIYRHSVPYLKFLKLIFFCSCKQIAFTFLKDYFLRWKKMLILGRAFLFYFLLFPVFFCISASTSLDFFQIQFYTFALSYSPLAIKQRNNTPMLLLLQRAICFPWLISGFLHLSPLPPFFPCCHGGRLDVGSSGSEKPSVAQRIIISHYFITYLLLSVI